MSEIRVTSVVGENGGDRVGLTTGLTVGPLTGTTGIGATISHQGHAQFAGVCTATSFVGSGANLTGTGKILQVVSTTKTDTASQASVAAGGKWSNTDFKVTITPSSASSKLLIFGIASFDTGNYSQALYLQKDGSDLAAAMGTPAGNRKGTVSQILDADGGAYQQVQHSFQFLDTAGNTNERYYNLAIGHGHNSTVNIFMNRSSTDADQYYQFRTQSTITVMEIAA